MSTSPPAPAPSAPPSSSSESSSGSSSEPRDLELRVAEDDAGERLDVFLARQLGLSRGQVRRLLGAGKVDLIEPGGPTRALGSSAKGLLLDAGLRVAVHAFRRPEDERALPDPALVVPVLAEGPGWLAVDKPAGAPVHPLFADEIGSVLGALLPVHPEIHGVGEGGLRSGVVHRLDVDTSGVLLVATAQASWERLRSAFREHRVGKRYRALVHGTFSGEARIECPLIVASHRPARVRVCEFGVRGAVVTRHTVRELEVLCGGRATLVEVDLETGFLHQIRATLAERGHPVIGDLGYGRGTPEAPGEFGGLAKRQMLHCAHIAVDEIDARSSDPADFASALDALRRGESTC